VKPPLATCIGCGCDDDHACELGCAWLVVERRVGLGVCSECGGHWQKFLALKKARWCMPVNYKIATSLPIVTYVHGYAVKLPPPFSRLRFCVREDRGQWTVDHFDSGMSCSGPVMSIDERRSNVVKHVRKWRRDGRSRARAVRWLVDYLTYLRRSGKLRPLFEKHGYGWCLREAGL
jgi:hypothetical protein